MNNGSAMLEQLNSFMPRFRNLADARLYEKFLEEKRTDQFPAGKIVEPLSPEWHEAPYQLVYLHIRETP